MAAKKSAFTVILFGHSTCVPCKQMARDLKARKVKFRYFDVKTKKGLAKGIECGIGTSVPWVVVLKKDVEVMKENGYSSELCDEVATLVNT